ncbi:MAG: hypothetical protein IT429_00870 [Gemmataceae bacterium]|nr:hypothetical protein [Gemmataceae bacterium]
MITLRASAAYGYGRKQYIARVTGRDPKWGLKLEFCGRIDGDRKRQESSSWEGDEPGIYVTRDVDRKGRADDTYRIILPCPTNPDRAVCSTPVDKEDIMKIARRLDAGERLERIVELVGRPSSRDPSRTVYDVEVVTARQAEAREVARTIDTATEECWRVLQALPEKEARKVLATLRQRVTPPKPATSLGMPEDTPAGIVADANQDAGVDPAALALTPHPVATPEADPSH